MNSKKYGLVIIFTVVFISIIKVTSLFYNNTPSIASDKILTDKVTTTTSPAFDDTQSIANNRTDNFIGDSTTSEKQKNKLSQLIENCINNIELADNNDDITSQLDSYITSLKLSNNSNDMLALFMQNYQASNIEDSDSIFELPPTSLKG